MTEKDIQKLYRQKEAALDETLKGLDADIRKLQRQLFEELFNEIIIELKAKDGNLLTNSDNFQLINNKLDQLFNAFTTELTSKLSIKIGTKMLENIKFTDKYYRDAIGLSTKMFAKAQLRSSWVYDRIGITKEGNIIPGSYLDKLSDMPEVKTNIRDYIVNNVTSGTGQREFHRGLKDLIVGGKDIEGSMVKYHQQYSFDIFNQVDSAVNDVFAEVAGLEYFIYEGTIIETSRCFCKKRALKVFSVKDAQKWHTDVSLLKWYQTHPYSWSIDRGGFNCRHNIRYITKQMAKLMGYNITLNDKILADDCSSD